MQALAQHAWPPADHLPDPVDAWSARDDGVLRIAIASDGQVIGAQLYQRIDSTQGWLSGLRIHPEHKRRPVAALLFDDIIQTARAERLLILRHASDVTDDAVHRVSQEHHMRPRGTWLSFERTMDAAACEIGRSKTPLGPAATVLGHGERLRALSLLHASGKTLYAQDWTWRSLDAAAISTLAQDSHAFLARSGMGGWSLGLLAQHPDAELEATLYGTDSACAQSILDHLRRTACGVEAGVRMTIHVPQDSAAAAILGSLARRGEWRPLNEHAMRVWELELTARTESAD